jgi:DNA-directed RNA polymerase subunit omega
MYNRHSSQNNQLMRQAEELISGASNRYRITVQVANRAKRRRQEDFDNMDEPTMKPVIQAVVEMWEELNQPEIIAD